MAGYTQHCPPYGRLLIAADLSVHSVQPTARLAAFDPAEHAQNGPTGRGHDPSPPDPRLPSSTPEIRLTYDHETRENASGANSKAGAPLAPGQSACTYLRSPGERRGPMPISRETSTRARQRRPPGSSRRRKLSTAPRQPDR
jgi:hypothetical protein